jgi:hypothetical protein
VTNITAAIAQIYRIIQLTAFQRSNAAAKNSQARELPPAVG